MSTSESSDILIAVDTVDQLFNGSGINPFSKKPAVILGEAGLLIAIRRELSRGLRNWKGKRLVIQLPPDQISSDLSDRVKNGIHQYAQAKMDENNTMIRLSRMRSLVGLCLAILVATALLTLLAILTQTVLASASDAVIGIVAGLITIFIWSTVWNPWDRLVYEWIEPWRENRILTCLLTMDIVIQPAPDSVH